VNEDGSIYITPSADTNAPALPKKAALQRHRSHAESQQTLSNAISMSRQSLTEIDADHQVSLVLGQMQKTSDITQEDVTSAFSDHSQVSRDATAKPSDSFPADPVSRHPQPARRKLPQIPSVKSLPDIKDAHTSSHRPSTLSNRTSMYSEEDSAYESDTSDSSIDDADAFSPNANHETDHKNQQILAIVGLIYCPTFTDMKADFGKVWSEAKSRVCKFFLDYKSICKDVRDHLCPKPEDHLYPSTYSRHFDR